MKNVNLPSMRSQCPVMTQMQTMDTERQKAIISAPVNLPHIPNDILKSMRDISSVRKLQIDNSDESSAIAMMYNFSFVNIPRQDNNKY